MNSDSEEPKELIRQAVAVAAIDPSIAMYQLTVKEVDLIACQIHKVMQREGFKISKIYKSQIEEQPCKTS